MATVSSPRFAARGARRTIKDKGGKANRATTGLSIDAGIVVTSSTLRRGRIFRVFNIHYLGSKPRPHADRKTNLTRIASIFAHEGGGFAKTFVERNTDIGGNLASDVIAQPNPEFHVVEPGTGREFLDSLDSGVGLEAALKNQSLRQPQVWSLGPLRLGL